MFLSYSIFNQVINKQFHRIKIKQKIGIGTILSCLRLTSFFNLQAVKEGRVFVLHHEDYENYQQAQDYFDKHLFDEYKSMKKVSPIALFILDGKNELQPMAIQKDAKPGKAIIIVIFGNIFALT